MIPLRFKFSWDLKWWKSWMKFWKVKAQLLSAEERSDRRRTVCTFFTLKCHYYIFKASYIIQCHWNIESFYFQEYFIIMQSIFWPSSGINERYDLKGCTGGRKEDPQELSEFNEIVLKDGNFLNTRINLGQNKLWYKCII